MKQNNTITKRFLRYLISFIIISNLLVFGSYYWIMQNSIRLQSIDMSTNLLNSNLTMMDQYFNDIDYLADSVIYNPKIIAFLKTEQETATNLLLLDSIESIYYHARPDLTFIFYKEGKYYNKYSINQEDGLGPIPNYTESEWYQKIQAGNADKVIVTNNTSEETNRFIHSVIYRIRDLYQNQVVGYLRIDMDLNFLNQRFLHSYKRVSGTTIADQNGDTLFYDQMVVPLPAEVLQKQETGIYETGEHMIIYGISQNTGWLLKMALSRHEISKAREDMFLTWILILSGVILTAIWASNKFFRIITLNYKRLIEGMEQVRQGNLTTQIKDGVKDEISELIWEFNAMMKKVNELVEVVEYKQVLLKEAEIKALQQQINPHFMYNTMETIIGLASCQKDKDVITVCKCMNAMLRYNTRFENVTDLKEELNQVKNYIQVMKIRFEDRFLVYFDTDKDCESCKIVKFVLQPLVENAISHGLSNTDSDGLLRIRIKREGKGISILVFDNGTGMEPEQLSTLNRRLAETSEHTLVYIEQYKSLGLLNVHLRLKLYYGEAYSMEIFSKKGKGTCISLLIPFVNHYEPERR